MESILKGPFRLDVEKGYATVYNGNNLYVPELTDIELGYTDTATGDYVSSAEVLERLKGIVTLMNLGWAKHIDSLKEITESGDADKLSNTEKSLAKWQKVAYNQQKEAEYYRRQLVDAHALLGRVIHQYSLLWDSVNLGEDFPTDNPYHRRNFENPTGTIKHNWEENADE
jgi:hypothetical protein